MPADSEPTAQSRSLRPVAFIARHVLVFLIVAIVTGSFLYFGGWFSLHTLTPARMIDTFELANGPHPGFRRNHAKGVGVSGYFDSNGAGAELSKASIFLPGRVPVIGRFALAGGNPFQSDAPHTTRSMAILFKLPDGQEWRTGMNNIPVFAVNSAQAFADQLLAFAPDPLTGKPDPQKIADFLADNPASAKAIQLIKAAPVSSGFDNSTFNSLDAFRFISANGKTTNVRWAMVPSQPFVSFGAGDSAESNPDYLFDDLIAAVGRGPLQWHLILTIADPSDPTNDATLPWPPDRRQIDVGTLTVDHIESEATSPARDINFDPLILPEGIAPSDDPLLSARSAAYSVSFTRRESEEKTPSAVTPAEVGK
jgi:catalase